MPGTRIPLSRASPVRSPCVGPPHLHSTTSWYSRYIWRVAIPPHSSSEMRIRPSGPRTTFFGQRRPGDLGAQRDHLHLSLYRFAVPRHRVQHLESEDGIEELHLCAGIQLLRDCPCALLVARFEPRRVESERPVGRLQAAI